MLKLRALSRYLERVKSDGVQSVMIFSTEGVPLTQCGADLSACKTTAAIVSNVWSLYQRQLAMNESDTMQDIIVEMTNARLVFTKVANFIICLTTTKDMNLGLMRAKINLLAENLQEPLFSLTAND
nr:ragulator complex protein LAMTOR2 [Hymenolepis microstoma]